jgi:small conductance mechanosensitive channel
MLANIIGGFTLIYTHPFSAGDYVEIASKSGTIHEIGIAYTKLITPDNKVISIPNSAVVSSEIVNYTVRGTRRVDIAITASYDADTTLVVNTLLATAVGEDIMQDPAPFAKVTNYGDSSIEYVLRVWTAQDKYWDVYFDLLHKIKPAFDKNGIEMTYPHLNVHLDK